jgi:hypothetical protein
LLENLAFAVGEPEREDRGLVALERATGRPLRQLAPGSAKAASAIATA